MKESEMKNLDAFGLQRRRYGMPAVAAGLAPAAGAGIAFRAQNADALCFHERGYLLYGGAECIRRNGSKSLVSQHIAPPEISHRQMPLEICLVEPRLIPALGHRPHVDHERDPLPVEQLREFIERTRGMAAGENDGGCCRHEYRDELNGRFLQLQHPGRL